MSVETASSEKTGGEKRRQLPISLSLITGFLGSGKTSLLNKILKDPSMADTAVIINEFGEIGIDHLLVEQVGDNIMELSSGCLCCTIRGDLITTLENFVQNLDEGRMERLSRVVIETTGLADPAPILHTVMLHPYLKLRYQLESVVVLADAINGEETLNAHQEAVRQIAVGDRIVLTKTDLVKSAEEKAKLEALKERIYGLNPGAKVIEAQSGEATPSHLFDTGLYNPETKIPDVARWLNEEAYLDDQPHDHHHHHDHDGHEHHDHDGHHHHHDVNRHGDKIRAFTLSTERPLSTGALDMFLDVLRSAHGPNMLRIKGIVQLKEHPEQPVVVHGVQHVFHPPVTLDKWPDEDHRTRLVFITYDLPESFVRQLFDAFSGALKPDTPDAQAMMDNPLAISGFSGM